MRIFLTCLLWLISFTAQASLFNNQPKFLPSDKAFIFSHSVSNENIQLHWQIADGYYLYKKEIEISADETELGQILFPASELHHDEFFGEVEIFRNELNIQQPLAERKGRLSVRYQGCTKGFCYPPETVTIELAQQAVENEKNLANNFQKTTASPSHTYLATQLASNPFSIFWFFVLGLGLAFTPCVLPMFPLLSAIVIGKQERPNTFRAFLLSLSYVQGMAFTYTLLGLLVASIGLQFQIALQSPPVLIGLALLFTLLALSMFGLFTLELPHAWQQKLNALSQQQKGGAYGSVFIMGMIAGLIASPCTSAPLSGALLYVAQSGDLLTGGLALYLLALGMGLPLIAMTLFGNKILPKSGDWLLKVKTLFGFVMLALPVFLLSRVLPTEYEPLMWSALAVTCLIWVVDGLSGNKWWAKFGRVLAILLIVLNAKPWTDLIFTSEKVSQNYQTIGFERISSLAELNQKLAQAKGKKVIFDLYADWCVACKEFEKYTFSDAKVQEKFKEMVLIQVDMTLNSPENSELMKHFQVQGLPTIIFFDEEGQEIPQARLAGFLGAEAFLNWLNNL